MRGGTTNAVAAYALRGFLSQGLRWTPLAIWFCAVITLMAALALKHQFALAAPDRRDVRLARALAQIMPDARGWIGVHALYNECRCSQRIFAHLQGSRRPARLREVVLLVGEDHDRATTARLSARGFQVFSLEPEQLRARFGIEAAPTFALIDPTRTVRYLGGYTPRRQSPDVRDLAIVSAIRAGDEVADQPIFGCAVSQRLKAFFDPFAMRR